MTRILMKNVTCILHSPADTPGTFQEYFARHGNAVKLRIAPEMRPPDFDQAARAEVLLVMGGAMGVYEQDEHPFLKKEIEVLKRRMESDLPTLGICLGAQLLAAAAGAKVYLSEREEFGWFPVQLTTEGRTDPVIGKRRWQEPVFHWHQDAFDLPKSFTPLLSSERCASQAFRVAKKIYGFQFHLELDARELPDWIQGESDLAYGNPGIQTREEILSNGALYGPDLKRAAFEVLSNLDRKWR